jgi:HupE / UreJ protein
MGRVAALVVLVTLLPATRLLAHDIPRDVTVQAFAKPEGHSFTLLVRVPLKAIMDIEFPRKERDFMDLARIDQALRDASMIWLARKVELYEEDTLLPQPQILSTRVSLESDRSFTSYEAALAHVNGPPLTNDISIFWEQGLLDVLFEYPIQSDQSRFSIHMAFDRLGIRVVTALRFMPPTGVVRPYELEGDAGLIPLDPRWQQAVLRFVNLGFFHILDGTDHLLFLFCLVIPFRRMWTLVPIVTSFTVAHSITLIASAYNYAPGALWFPPLIETLIATSIVYMALENIVLRSTDTPGALATPQRRWIITFLFGLVHGFGFSFGLQHTLQFAGSYLLSSLLSFNLGVELGQLLVLVVIVPALGVLFRFVVAERMGTIILSAIIAHTAWHWMTERYAVLQQFPWPAVTAADAASAIRWVMLLIVLLAGAYLLGRAAASARASDTPRTPGRVPKSGPALRTESPD